MATYSTEKGIFEEPRLTKELRLTGTLTGRYSAYSIGNLIYDIYERRFKIAIPRKSPLGTIFSDITLANTNYIAEHLKPVIKKAARPYSKLKVSDTVERPALQDIVLIYEVDTGLIVDHKIEKLKTTKELYEALPLYGTFLLQPELIKLN
jgi:hypothetical protein